MGRMSRKGTEATLYILIISNISHDPIKHRKTASFLCWDMDPGLGHKT
jgi:hypothetical protein